VGCFYGGTGRCVQYNNPRRASFPELNNNFDEIYEAFEEDETEIADGLMSAGHLDDNEEEDTAYGFMRIMVWLALTVANALRVGYWRHISDKEQPCAFVADALGLMRTIWKRSSRIGTIRVIHSGVCNWDATPLKSNLQRRFGVWRNLAAPDEAPQAGARAACSALVFG
jgi:hypothetical protein